MNQTKPLLILLLLIVSITGCMQPRVHFSEAVTRFDKKYRKASTLYFYPAVLQTLNLTHDSTYAAITKGIQELRVLQYSKDSINPEIADTLISDVKHEHFLETLEMQREGYRMSLLVQKQGKKIDHYILVAYSPGNMIVVDLVGEIPLMYLPGLLTRDVPLGGIETVLNYKPKPRKSKSKNGKNSGNK
ncbi:MAG: DUF4252 domain-containing protein [Bacteroidales bacterium]|nr:DUF4252 domain-containing protein [Bacteroidales bacterium]